MNTSNDTYQKLDRAALWLLVGEFGLAALLLALLVLMVIGNLISSSTFRWGYNTGQLIAVMMGVVYGLAYLGNLMIGMWGLILHTLQKREGYPGTGHLLNWTLLSATLVIVLVLIAAAFSSL